MDMKYGIVEKIMLKLLQDLIEIYDVADRVSYIDSYCDDTKSEVVVEFYCRSPNFKSIHKDRVSFRFPRGGYFSDIAMPQMVRAICSRGFSLILLKEEFFHKYADRVWKIR